MMALLHGSILSESTYIEHTMIIFSVCYNLLYDCLLAVVLMTETSCENQTASTINFIVAAILQLLQDKIIYISIHMQMFDAYINMLHSMMISDDFANNFTLQMPS